VIDPGRLSRAVHLRAERQGDVWIVTGGAAPHVVREVILDGTVCDCLDAISLRGWPCKHRMACALAVLDEELLAGLRTLVVAEASL
jgi:predicted nucleic acid-binding Zn finger protein